MTYSSTAAVYAFAIAGVHSSKEIVNLDIFGLWAILSSASISILPLLQWNKNFQHGANKGGRSIVRIWGVLVIAAMICIYVMLLQSKHDVAQGETVEQCRLLVKKSSSAKSLLRNPEDVLSAAYPRIFGTMYGWITRRISGLVFLPTAFGLVTIMRESSIYHAEENRLGDFPVAGGDFTIFKSLRSGFVTLRTLVVYMTPLFLIPTIVLNELYLSKNGGVPEGEKIYEVGQWGVFVGAGLVGVAALINFLVGEIKRKEREIRVYAGDRIC